jgi:capsular polysaccharide biosynthesis protein
MEDTISLSDIFNSLKKRWKLIVLLVLTAVTISGFLSYFVITPIYQSTTQLLVNQKDSENQLDITLMESNIEMINTYAAIIKSPAILEKVIEKLDLKQSVEQLNQTITINSQENSQVFTLIAENPDAWKAVEIANTVSETFQDEITGIMNVDNVSILAQAKLKDNPTPVKPNPLLNIIIGLVVGMMLGIGIAILLDSLDKTLKNEQDVAAYLGLPVLGSIQKMSTSRKEGKKNTLKEEVGGETVVS